VTKYANGAKAVAFCDRCNFRFPLGQLRSETVRGKKTNWLVCSTCFDPDHPQNFQGMVPVEDPQAIRNPRPDPALEASREIPDNGQEISDLYFP
jgi:hypothetical protein